MAITLDGTNGVTTPGILNAGSAGSGNIGTSINGFNTVFAKSTSAQYADLAEKYVADAEYAPGTVLVFGGSGEVTVSDISHDTRIAGIVSTEPCHLMNSDQTGQHVVAVALTGRVPCFVQGPVDKGDRLVNIASGVAGRLESDKAELGCIIGKSLETIADNNKQLIEVAVGRY